MKSSEWLVVYKKNLTAVSLKAGRSFGFIICLVAMMKSNVAIYAQKPQKPVSPLAAGRGKISYTPDSLGNRIVDFSYCGYMASNEAIPDVPVKIVVPVTKGDATLRIQSAIDYVSSLPPDQNGFRGAVLLQKGTYVVSGQLKLMASGVVLRGSGMQAGGTIITGAGKDRETLIRIFGRNDKQKQGEIRIADAYVPVNATSFSVVDASSFKVGDNIIVHRPSTLHWIKLLGTETFGGGISALGWKPSERDIYFERKITAVNGNSITIDVPLTTALDTTFGGGMISKFSWNGRIEKTGVENLTLQSEYDASNPKDEAHRWMAIVLENVEDAWVRQITFKHFAGSAVAVLESSKRITVEDCKSLAPVSEIGGQRRNTFFTSGQQTLFQRCYAENGFHDFSVGFCAPGPNAFVQCQSSRPYSFSGTIDSWASGVLFDIVNVDGNAIRFGNREQDGNGAGWSAANSVLWQCSAARIDCYKPPTANNYSFGSWAQFGGDGYWESSNEQIQPRSLYYAQLSDRLGSDVMKRAFILPVETEASSSPPVDVAMALTKKAYKPAPLLTDWIDATAKQNAGTTNSTGVKTIDQTGIKKVNAIKSAPSMVVSNGWLVRGNEIVTGRRSEVQWWNGNVQPKDLPQMKPHITRFVPGRTGTGLTDDLDSVTDWMQKQHVVAIEHNYGLWYERRRDDHERIRRMDGDVWPPFYELPFARSGKDSAWDGLSKYDLTKYNAWYWQRLKQFADLADQKSLVLVHNNYFQHNIIEAGAHYADFPWRTANNINNTGFPEPVPYAGDKRIFMAEQFYDVTDANRRKLHTAYIRKCLDNFKDNTGVIQLIGAEFTGPSHFVRFWVDVIKQWEKETGKKEIIGLSTTKDVQDSILAEAARAAVIDVIDIRYWHYQEDGKAYEPKGGQNLAPRQHARLLKPKRTSFEQVYRAVSEYKQKFPSKAVMYSGDSYDQFGWAVFIAGGSMAVLPRLDSQFLADASSMKPVFANTNGQWAIKGEKGMVVYTTNNSVATSLSAGSYDVKWIDVRTGDVIKTEKTSGTQSSTLANPKSGPVVVWIRRTDSQAQIKRLSISPSHRFFIDEKGQPFFWLGDTGWLLFSKLTREEAEKYLEDRKKKGFNVIQVMVLHTVAAVNVYGDSALIDRNVATPVVTQGNSFSNKDQYDYWDHVDFIVDLAAKKGLYMAMVPVWGSNVKSGWVKKEDAATYAAWLANRYKNRWNIIWLNGGDIKGTDSTATWNLIGQTLKQNDPNHLVTFHPFGRTSSSEYFHAEPWLDFNMFQSGHRSYDLDTSKSEHRYGPDNYKFLEVDYNLTPTKPSFDGEPSYELIPHGLHDTTKPYWQPADVRRYAYWSVFAGGAGHTYGHNSVMQMHKPTDKGSAYGSKKYWYDALNDEGAREMQYLKKLILSKSYFDRVPDQSLIAGDAGEKYNHLAATRGKNYAFVYDYTGRTFEVNMGKFSGKKVEASWYSPRDGSKKSIGKFDNKGVQKFDPPGEEGEGNDWVLVLESKS